MTYSTENNAEAPAGALLLVGETVIGCTRGRVVMGKDQHSPGSRAEVAPGCLEDFHLYAVIHARAAKETASAVADAVRFFAIVCAG
jgi:hypothetical protein